MTVTATMKHNINVSILCRFICCTDRCYKYVVIELKLNPFLSFNLHGLNLILIRSYLSRPGRCPFPGPSVGLFGIQICSPGTRVS